MHAITRTIRNGLLAGVLSLLAPAVPASVLDSVTPSPGRMGPNALPVPPVWYPAPDSIVSATIAADGYTDPRGDRTVNPFLRIAFPLRDVAAFAVFTRPVEYFRTTESLRHYRGARETSGLSQGDLSFQTLIRIMREKDARPALGFAYTVKTTTGKDLENARHLNAPAYFFDLAAGKSWTTGNGQRVAGAAGISFIAWQTRTNQQNDALGWGARMSLDLRRPWRFVFEAAGYQGWQDNGDRPAVLRVEASRTLGRWVEVFGRGQYGLSDQSRYAATLGIIAHIAPRCSR